MNPVSQPGCDTTHRFPLLTGGAHETTVAPVTLQRPGKRTESGAAPGSAPNPAVPPTHLQPGDTLWSWLTARSGFTLRGDKQKPNPTKLPLSCVHMPLSALHPSPRDLLPCPCPLQPHEGLSLQQVAKEGLEKWPQGQGEEEG